MKQENLYVDINVLQTVPSSNINRDDTGSPKTAVYGGVTRSRVSSQSWKRAMRIAFAEDNDDAEWLKGHRTKRSAKLLADELMKQDGSLSFENARKKAKEILSAMGVKFDRVKKSDKNDDKDYETKVLLFFSHGELEKLAKYALTNDEFDKKEAKKLLNENQSIDIALFGRMVADDPELNVDASSQVAHAISTHEIVPEFDYFTAVDDAQSNGESGSAMLGTIEYDSSTLYRYANVNVKELINNIGNNDVAIKGLRAFLKAFVMSMPNGKQNTFANKTVPQYVMVTVRKDTPVNLVSAFEEPVTSRKGYLQPSIKKLEKEFQNTQKFVQKPLATFVLTTAASGLEGQADNLDDLMSKVVETVETRVKNEDANN